MAVGEQHHQAIDADSLARGRRHAKLERTDVVLVHRMRLLIAARALAQLILEPALLLHRIVQLAEGVGHLEAPDESSNRSTVSGSSGFCLASGDTSVGKS